MKTQKTTKKLVLAKETVINLDNNDLNAVRGGGSLISWCSKITACGNTICCI
jgi:hypothetical protein